MDASYELGIERVQSTH